MKSSNIYYIIMCLMGLSIFKCNESQNKPDPEPGCLGWGISIYIKSQVELDAILNYLKSSKYKCAVDDGESDGDESDSVKDDSGVNDKDIYCNFDHYDSETMCDGDRSALEKYLADQNFVNMEIRCVCTSVG